MTAPRRIVLFLCLGLIAASQSGNIIRLGAAHPVAMAAWRLAIAAVLFAPAARADGAMPGRLKKRELFLLLTTGLCLACHFFAWIAAVQLTTVANAAVFFSVNPVLTSAGAFFFFREKAGPRLFCAIALGILGAAVIGGGDLSFNRECLAGDGMALLCAALFSIYFLLGKRLRAVLSTTVYVTAVYGTAALAAFACLGILGLPLLDYPPGTWLCFILLALGPTMVGHTSFNSALRYIDAGKIAAATLSEPLLAGLVAFFAWGESVTAQTAAGYVLIALSVLVLARGKRRKSMK